MRRGEGGGVAWLLCIIHRSKGMSMGIIHVSCFPERQQSSATKIPVMVETGPLHQFRSFVQQWHVFPLERGIYALQPMRQGIAGRDIAKKSSRSLLACTPCSPTMCARISVGATQADVSLAAVNLMMKNHLQDRSITRFPHPGA